MFDYVAKLPASSLAAHGVSDPLPQQVRVEFDRYFCKAGQFPRPEELSRYDGFYITGSLAGVYDDEPWIKQLDSWTANAIRSGHKVRTAPAAQLLLKGCSIPLLRARWWGSPSATRWSCKPSVARLRVRPTTCQQLHFFRWGTRTGPLPAGNPYGSSVSKMGTKLTPEAQRYFGTNRSGFDLLYHHNDAVTRMPGPAAGLIEMGGNRTTPNNGVFDMRGTVLTFCGHPVRVSLSLLLSPSPCLSPSLFPPPLRPRCLTLCATTTAGLLAPSPRPARAVRDRSRLEVGGGPAARLWHHHLLRRDRL